jgi:hypothetical protein
MQSRRDQEALSSPARGPMVQGEGDVDVARTQQRTRVGRQGPPEWPS